MTEAELKIIGDAVGGTFFRTEPNDGIQPILVFSSHDFPAHRITVRMADAEKFIREVVAGIVANASAD